MWSSKRAKSENRLFETGKIALNCGLICLISLSLLFCGAKTSLATGSGSLADRQSNVQSLQTFLSDLAEAAGGAILEAGAGIKVSRDPYTGERVLAMGNDLGLIGKTGQLYSAVMVLPVSGTNYIASSLSDMGLDVPKAHAQGYGFYALGGIQDAWRIFRNVAFIFFAALALVVGFMNLLGQKFDGQVTLTVQKALPRIIAGMVLVTFSYAIAGLMIDAMYLIIRNSQRFF